MAETPTESPPPVSYPLLPSYPELIFAAIEAIDEKNGANKSSISKQIEATYGSLPAAHSTLLSHHLNKMKASGQLIVVKDNYVKPDPNGTPKRGRGRPAKPKEPIPEGTVVSPPRSRGRPPKIRDTAPVSSPEKSVNSPVKSMQTLPEGKVVSPPRPRGRPRKVVQSPVDSTAEGTSVSSPRPRGRPPKQQDPLEKSVPTVSGRKRGRPPKSGKTSTPASSAPSGERRGRGRPPKLKTPAAAPVEA